MVGLLIDCMIFATIDGILAYINLAFEVATYGIIWILILGTNVRFFWIHGNEQLCVNQRVRNVESRMEAQYLGYDL